MTELEEVRGDFGYSGNIPVNLRGYREIGWLDEKRREVVKVNSGLLGESRKTMIS